MTYEVRITPTALRLLREVADRRVRTGIRRRIDALAEEPEKQGKPLVGELAGYRSLRAVGQRYRIIYRVQADLVIVTVVALGIRKEGDRHDAYALAQRLMRLGHLEPSAE